MDIRRLDWNLLPVLDALLRYQSVTLAARELDMTQSAMSSALARLRVSLGDALFVRTGRGLRPTERASALAGPVGTILAEVLDKVLQGGTFEPRTATRQFSVCLSDQGIYLLLPTLINAVHREAPHISLRLRTLEQPAIVQALESGTVDIAIGAFLSLPSSLYQRRLFERPFVCAMRVGHPLAGRTPTIRQFASAPHIVVRTAAGVHELIDEALRRQDHQRTRILEMPSYLAVEPMLESGDWVAVMPGQLADAFGRHGKVVNVKLPVSLPVSTVRVYWHRRVHEDAGNVWLRRLIAEQLAQA